MWGLLQLQNTKVRSKKVNINPALVVKADIWTCSTIICPHSTNRICDCGVVVAVLGVRGFLNLLLECYVGLAHR